MSRKSSSINYGGSSSVQKLQPCHVIEARNPKIIDTGKNLLEFFIKKESSVRLSRDPLSHFSQEEVVLHAQDTLLRIKRKIMNYVDMRESIENLVGLHNLCLNKDPAVGVKLGLLLERYIGCIADFAGALERVDAAPQTDWIAIGQAIVQKGAQYNTSKQSNCAYFIPRMNDFRKLKLLGAGGFGAVYLASYKPVSFVCTVKLVSLESFKKYKQACVDKVVTSVARSPFLVKYYTCYQVNEAYITVMEYIPGLDLMRVVTQENYLDADSVQIVTAQLLLALEHMHIRGFIHRDVKVSNMLIVVGGRCKVIDFDTAKVCQGHFSKRFLSSYFRRTAFEFRDGESAGTLPYMAPEILQRKPYARAIDWWSTGVTIYKMATGRVPFRAKSKSELRHQICSEKLKWPRSPDHPHSATIQTKDYVYRLLKKNPLERLGSGTYLDLKYHSYFDNFGWDYLYESNELCDIPSIAAILAEDAKKKKASDIATKRELLDLDEMTDLPPKQQRPLLCMASMSWKRLILLVKEYGIDQMDHYEEGCIAIDDDFMETEHETSSEIDYRTAASSNNSMGSNMLYAGGKQRQSDKNCSMS